jgi:hypothetical protein
MPLLERVLHNANMLNVHELSPHDFVSLSPSAAAELAARVLAHFGEQNRQIESQAQAIQFKDAKIDRILFELRRLKAWRFDAKTERMNAEQRQLFEETLAADQADLEAQLAALKAVSRESGDTTDSNTRRQPKRQVATIASTAKPWELCPVEIHLVRLHDRVLGGRCATGIVMAIQPA